MLSQFRDVLLIQEGIGEKLGNFIQFSSMFIGGFAVGFVYGWKMALVILSVTPILMVCGAFLGMVDSLPSTLFPSHPSSLLVSLPFFFPCRSWPVWQLRDKKPMPRLEGLLKKPSHGTFKESIDLFSPKIHPVFL